jgi:enoyl-CoA hydratase
MTYACLTLAVTDHVAHVQLSRPDELNSMTPVFWPEMVQTFAEIDDCPDVRAVVISSTGKHFTAGLDLKTLASEFAVGPGEDPGRVREKLRRKIVTMQESFSVIDRCRVPVIAAIQGGCIGGGVDLVTACDIRIGTAGCFFVIQEVNIGIVADLGTLQRITHLLPQGIARELAYTGRRFGADEALSFGFVNKLLPDHQTAVAAALSTAAEIAAKSPMVVGGIKQVLNYGRHHSIEDGLDYVATWNAAMLLGADLEESLTASKKKQVASFANLKKL